MRLTLQRFKAPTPLAKEPFTAVIYEHVDVSEKRRRQSLPRDDPLLPLLTQPDLSPLVAALTNSSGVTTTCVEGCPFIVTGQIGQDQVLKNHVISKWCGDVLLVNLNGASSQGLMPPAQIYNQDAGGQFPRPFINEINYVCIISMLTTL
jgi:hypothetical protein